MTGISSFLTTLPVHSTIPTIPTNNSFLFINQFSRPYFTSLPIHKTIPTIPSTLSSSIILPFCVSILHTAILQFSPKIVSHTLTIQSNQAVSRAQWAIESCVDWHFFDMFLFLLNMDRDNSAHNHWLPMAQGQKLVYCRY